MEEGMYGVRLGVLPDSINHRVNEMIIRYLRETEKSLKNPTNLTNKNKEKYI